MRDTVSVITLTHDRLELLERAIDCVARQELPASALEHLVIVDGCPVTRESLSTRQLPPWLRWHYCSRDGTPPDLVPRLAFLRNLGVRLARMRWVCFLDDDNQFEPAHLRTLLDCAHRTGSPAVHSWGRIFRRDGSPYLEPRVPWVRDRAEAERHHAELCKLGVWERESNLLRDRADPRGHPQPVHTVDMGMWLFERPLLLRYPFPEHYSPDDWKALTTEDDKLMLRLVANDIPLACTKLPTFYYYLGGFTTVSDR